MKESPIYTLKESSEDKLEEAAKTFQMKDKEKDKFEKMVMNLMAPMKDEMASLKSEVAALKVMLARLEPEKAAVKGMEEVNHDARLKEYIEQRGGRLEAFFQP